MAELLVAPGHPPQVSPLSSPTVQDNHCSKQLSARQFHDHDYLVFLDSFGSTMKEHLCQLQSHFFQIQTSAQADKLLAFPSSPGV